MENIVPVLFEMVRNKKKYIGRNIYLGNNTKPQSQDSYLMKDMASLTWLLPPANKA